MNFSLSWFTSTPGLLITGGVVLLIIALIILIMNGKKTKAEIKSANKDINQSSGFNSPSMAMPISNNMSPMGMEVQNQQFGMPQMEVPSPPLH